MTDSRKTQRWIDLIACLLAHRAPLTFAEIERDVPGYLGKAKPTQKRMFERDKKELRALGVPIESIGEEGEEESRYRLSSKDFYLPYLAVTTSRGTSKPRRVDKYGYQSLTLLAFEPDELVAVAAGAARVRVLGDPALTADAESAMRKLAFDLPVGVLAAPDQVRVVRSARAQANAKALERLGLALLARKRVEIDYRGMSSDVQAKRTVEPFGLFFLSAHWYLVARDVERDELRNYRVNRIFSVTINATREGTPDYMMPPEFDLREHARSKQAWELGEGDVVPTVVDFRAESGATHAAAALGAPVAKYPSRRAFDVRRVDVFARWLLSFAGEAKPVSPPSVVEEFVRLVNETRGVYA